MKLVRAPELQKFAADVFKACGAPNDQASIIAEHLVNANLLGFDSHGVVRIPMYLGWVRDGVLQPGGPITIKRESPSTAVLDCGWNFGQVGALRATELAIAKARTANVAVIATQRCGHAGRMGTYTEMAAEQGFVALSFCNSWKGGHFVPPWGGTQGRLATNPISYAAPCDGNTIVGDFSTAEAAEGVLRIYRNQGKRLPAGWILDAQGNPSQDPNDFYGPPRGAILPFGGEKGYRGFALGLLVEIMAGVLSGNNRIAQQDGNGFCLLVINVASFQEMTDFNSLISDTRNYIKSSPAQSGAEVLMPGEPDKRKRETRLQEGIPIDENTWSSILEAAQTVGVGWTPSKVV